MRRVCWARATARNLDGGERRLKDPAAMTAVAERAIRAVGDDRTRDARLPPQTEGTGQSANSPQPISG
jgi:error-prone DNA polymerase